MFWVGARTRASRARHQQEQQSPERVEKKAVHLPMWACATVLVVESYDFPRGRRAEARCGGAADRDHES